MTTKAEEKPAEKIEEKPGEKPADKPGEKPEDKPGEKPAEKPGEKPGEQGKTPKDGEKPEGKDDKGEKTPKSEAPEKYELKLPEGALLDDDDMKNVEEVARENGWSNEVAQAMLESHVQAQVAQSERFLEQAKADKEYGGKNLDSNVEKGLKVLDKLRPKGTPHGDAFRTLLNKSGYGNHIEVIGFFADLAKAMEEDGHTSGTGGSGGQKSTADVLYDHTPKP